MGRPPINISVLVSSTHDSRFVRPLRFNSIRRLSEDTGISLRAASMLSVINVVYGTNSYYL